jgi:prevent-host-death family protein
MHKMQALDIFTARDLRNNVGGLMKDAEAGEMALITKRGKPTVMAIPFDKTLLSLGVNRSLALKLYEQKLTSLSQSAKVADVSVYDFLEMLKTTDIAVVDYPADELKAELDILPDL